MILASIIVLIAVIVYECRCNHDWGVLKEGKFEILLKCNKCGKLHKEYLYDGEFEEDDSNV